MSTTTDSLHSRSSAVFLVTTITFIITSVFVVARLVTRFGILKLKSWDDWFIIFAWFFAFGLNLSIDYATAKGLGKLDVNIKDEWRPCLKKAEYAITVLYNPCLMATKNSILIFYLRLSKDTQSLLRGASYATLAIVNLDAIVLTFLNLFQCNPVKAGWRQDVNGSCLSILTLYLASSSCVGENFAYNASLAFMWSAVEVNVGIVCACIPTLKPLMKRILPAMIMDRASGRRNSHTHSTDKFGSINSQIGAGVRPITSDLARPARTTTFFPPSLAPLSPLSNTHPGGHREDVEEQELDVMNFLATTPGTRLPTLRRNSTGRTANTTYFGFVNMRVPKTMMKTRGREVFKYCIMVTILFFLWGFSYGLLNRLNREIAVLANYSESQTIGLSAAYFGAYVAGALTAGQWVLRHSGFKATFIAGLCIYGTGTLMFWPSAVLTSFTGFMLSSVVVGFGLSILETAANPFLALCGPTQYAEFRLMLAQSVQAVASLVSQALAEKVLFRGVRVDGKKHSSLIDIQWAYLAIALFTVILALFFYYMPLPEASDADLQAQSELLEIYPAKKLPWTGTSIIYTTLVFGVVAQLCYVSAQQCLSEFFRPLLISYIPPASTFRSVFTLDDDEDYLLLGHGLFAIGRFIFAPLCLMFKPRVLLLVAFLGLTIFSAFIFAINDISQSFLVASSLLVFFFEGPVFPLVFSLTIRGMGKHTKWASAWHQVDPKAVKMGGGVWSRNGEEEMRVIDHRPDTPLRRLSRRVSILVQKISFSGRKFSTDLPIVEHRERRDERE
ncbi:hypothetical protein DID88_009016 [Monilinia fructigena]|uniref:Rhodopsin domain-containing protein n=1 Tax=Monilinia fructigena TaxID=38457 RepID=A0A395IF28_9HELO|nr:hypothetical protein DID88_009016 [Monilinia fructigena]